MRTAVCNHQSPCNEKSAELSCSRTAFHDNFINPDKGIVFCMGETEETIKGGRRAFANDLNRTIR